MKKLIYLLLPLIYLFACQDDDDEPIEFYPAEDAPFDIPVLEWGKNSAYVLDHTVQGYEYLVGWEAKDVYSSKIIILKKVPNDPYFYFNKIEYGFNYYDELEYAEIRYNPMINNDEYFENYKEYFRKHLGKESFKETYRSEWKAKNMRISIVLGGSVDIRFSKILSGIIIIDSTKKKYPKVIENSEFVNIP